MRTLVAVVTHIDEQVGFDLALHIEAPFLSVRLPPVHADSSDHGGRGIGGRWSGCWAVERRVDDTRGCDERRIAEYSGFVPADRGRIVINSVSCAHRGFAVLKWIPGNAHAWRQIDVSLLHNGISERRCAPANNYPVEWIACSRNQIAARWINLRRSRGIVCRRVEVCEV